MGFIPNVDKASLAFIHVDVDDLWAIAECYGYDIAEQWAHHVSTDALPRFRALFFEFGIKATFFTVGRDLESPLYIRHIRRLLDDGHQAANHSYSHSLNFRALPPGEMEMEIDKCHALGKSALGIDFQGFRAPGYAWSKQLVQLLDKRGYKYDASLMPGPYGPVFRWMDSRLQTNKSFNPNAIGASPPNDHSGKPEFPKTQYPLYSDTWNSLYPTQMPGTRLIEIPSATSGLLRLPFQAGVCMRLGRPYFRACFEPYRWHKTLPFVFLFHAADLADFSPVPGDLFQQSSFFNMPIEKRLNSARNFLRVITENRPIITTEQWLA